MRKNSKPKRGSREKKSNALLYVLNDRHAFSPEGMPLPEWLELPLQLKKGGMDVRVALPLYSEIAQCGMSLEELPTAYEVHLGDRIHPVHFFHASGRNGLKYVFVKNDDFFKSVKRHREIPPDSEAAILAHSFFAHAAVRYLHSTSVPSDFILAYGWETGLIPALLKKLYAGETTLSRIRTIFCTHQFADQGNFDARYFPFTGLPWDAYNLHEMEFWGRFSLLKSGVVYSDAVLLNANESSNRTLKNQGACGMEGALETRKNVLWNVSAGVDYSRWNPRTDSMLKNRYDRHSFRKKRANKAAYCRKLELDIPQNFPLVAIAGSLEPYLEAGDLGNTLEVFTQLEAGFVFLGKENERVLQAFKKFTSTFRNRLGIIADGGPGEVHRALGAADILLVPSILDPLPFAHLYAQKYGTIPVVSQRFGSTQGIDPFERHHRKGNGFVFSGESACSMLGKLITAINAVRYDDHQESLIENGMNRRYSWKETQAGVEKIMKYLHRH